MNFSDKWIPDQDFLLIDDAEERATDNSPHDPKISRRFFDQKTPKKETDISEKNPDAGKLNSQGIVSGRLTSDEHNKNLNATSQVEDCSTMRFFTSSRT